MFSFYLVGLVSSGPYNKPSFCSGSCDEWTTLEHSHKRFELIFIFITCPRCCESAMLTKSERLLHQQPPAAVTVKMGSSSHNAKDASLKVWCFIIHAKSINWSLFTIQIYLVALQIYLHQTKSWMRNIIHDQCVEW